MSNRWLDDMRNKMEDHAEDVPDGLWDDIKDELFNDEDGKKIIGTGNDLKAQKISSNSIKTILYKVGSAAAVIVFCIIGGKKIFDLYQEKETSQQVLISSENIETVTSFPHSENKNSFAKKEKTNHLNLVIKQKNTSVQNPASFKTDAPDILPFSNAFTGYIFENQFNVESLKLDGKMRLAGNPFVDDLIFEKPKASGELLSKEQIIKLEKERFAQNQSKKSWTLGMLTGSTSQNSAEQFPGYATLNGATMSLSDEIWSAGYTDDPLTAILLANQDKEIEARIKHKVPVTFGLSLYRNIGKKWGVGTGINYTKLSTQLLSGSESDYIESDQSVHYIGIPVQINYNIIKKGKLTGYITAGGLAEKAVSADIRTKYIVNNEVRKETNENVGEKPLQISVNSALGLQLKVVDRIGIYAEPGVSYHFKDNSPLNTIYKDKPLNFNLKVGIRLTID